MNSKYGIFSKTNFERNERGKKIKVTANFQ